MQRRATLEPRRPQSYAIGAAVSFAAAPLGFSLPHNASGDAVVSIDWRAPRDCPDSAYVEREVSRLLTGAPPAGSAFLRAQAEITYGTNGKWRVDLTTTSPHGAGRRIVVGESCRALADATALILAFAVNPEWAATGDPAALEATPPPAGATSAVTTATSTAPPPTTASATTLPAGDAADDSPFPPARSMSRRKTDYAVGISVLGDVGMLRATAAGAGVWLAASPGFAPFLRAELGAALWEDMSFGGVSYGGSAFGAGTFQLHAGLRTFDLGACLVPVDGDWRLGACADTELAWITSGVVGGGRLPSSGSPAMPSSTDATWVVMRGRAMGGYRLSDAWLLRGDIGVGLGIDPPKFAWSTAGGSFAYNLPPVSGRASLGLELRF
jgi:hypothetical protein